MLSLDKKQKLAIRTTPKLTVRHISPTQSAKMKVKLATQVFSHSVAAGINTNVALNGLPSSAVGTAELILTKFLIYVILYHLRILKYAAGH